VNEGYSVNLVVADSKGKEIKDGINIIDVAKSNSSRVSKILTATAHIILNRPNLVHIHDPELIFSGLLFKALGIPVIFDMHEHLPKQILNKQWIPNWARKPLSGTWNLIERITLPFFSVVMAESSYEKYYPWIRRKIIVQNYPDAKLIPNHTRKFDIFTVGYIGSVTKERGAITVAAAIGMLRDKGVMVNFQCLGPVSTEVRDNEHFSRGIDEGWLQAPGRVKGSEGWTTISRCHVGVAVLAPIPNYVESWPTKMFEYMSMSMPVIVSNFPLYEELVASTQCGITVDPHKTSDIAEAIEFIASEPAIADTMGACGRAAVISKYSWDAEVGRLISLYRKIGTPRSTVVL